MNLFKIAWLGLFLLLTALPNWVVMKSTVKDNSNHSPLQGSRKPSDKLLIIVISGFRWDYLPRFTQRSGKEFPGFSKFMKEGLHTEYIKSVFPSESFPAWQTISTGKYPSEHGIIANQFYDPRVQGNNKFFNYMDERSTSEIKWYEAHEPIWATAIQQGLQFAAFLWSRCDVPWYGHRTYTPQFCENVYQKDGSKTLFSNVEQAVIRFQHGFDAAIVYEDSLGKAAEDHGPLSRKTEDTLRILDGYVKTILERLQKIKMDDRINIVITSDHGMAYGEPPAPQAHPERFRLNTHEIKKVDIGSVLEPLKAYIKMVVGSGAHSMVYPKDESDEFVNTIAGDLRKKLRGVDVYRKDEIPDHLHWKDNPNIPPILILARPGYVIQKAGYLLQRPGAFYTDNYSHGQGVMGLQNEYQQPRFGISGYDPDDSDMRGMFMTRGPGFKNELEAQEPIELVDLYQMFCFLLGIQPAENDGVWDRIRRLLRNSAPLSSSASTLLLVLSALITSYRA